MNVKVKLYQPFSGIAGRKELSMSLEIGNLGQLLENLCTDHPKMRDQIFDEEGNVMDHLNIFVNQVPVTSDKEKSMDLKDDDEVMLLVAVAGG